jgi:serine phosphatase RsbU (regulator of sigma subunit)
MQDDGTTWLRFSHYDPDRAIPAQAVFTGSVEAERLRGKIVLLGVSGLGVLDYKTTPLGEFIPGVAIHGQVIENLFNDVSLVRLEAARLIEALALAFCGLLLIAYVPRVSALKAIHLAFGLVVMLFGAGLIAFHHFHMLFDFAWPAIGTVAVFTSAIVGTLTETERQRRVLRDQAAQMAGEVNAARRIQMGLLPDPRELLGDGRRFQLAAELEPARTVGGDFYDCFMLGERRLFLVVADVSGKGLPAALFMASVKSHLKSAALRGGEVGDVLSRAQEEIARENPEQLFVTAFAAIVDVESGEVEFANAGHEPPFMRTPRGAPERVMDAGGPPLCVLQEYRFATWRRKLVPGEWLCIVTDGATEAMNPQHEFFGVERLRTSLSWMPEDADPSELIRRLREDISRFAAGAEAADDITLLVLRWMGADEPPPPQENS